MLQAKLNGSYRKAVTGTKVFRYVVSGSEKDLEAYKSAQADNLRTDEETGKPIWFTTRYIGDNVSLIITNENDVVADDVRRRRRRSQSFLSGCNEFIQKLQAMLPIFGPPKLMLLMFSLGYAKCKAAPSSTESAAPSE